MGADMYLEMKSIDERTGSQARADLRRVTDRLASIVGEDHPLVQEILDRWADTTGESQRGPSSKMIFECQKDVVGYLSGRIMDEIIDFEVEEDVQVPRATALATRLSRMIRGETE